MMHIPRGRIQFMVFHSDPYSVLCYSIYIYVIYSIFSNFQTLQAMGKILQFKQSTKKKNQSLVHQKHLHHCSLDGLITTSMIDGLPIDPCKAEVFLEITIDHELKLDNHVNHLCKKARLLTFMNVSKTRIFMKPFTESKFGDCPLIWMFHSRGLNNEINCIHERALRMTYNDKSS